MVWCSPKMGTDDVRARKSVSINIQCIIGIGNKSALFLFWSYRFMVNRVVCKCI